MREDFALTFSLSRAIIRICVFSYPLLVNKPTTVLWAEDDAGIRRLAFRRLAGSLPAGSFDLILAVDGDSARKAIASLAAGSIAVLDNDLDTGPRGVDLVRKAISQGCQLVILHCSAPGNPSERTKIKELLASFAPDTFMFFEKPDGLARAVDAIREKLALARANE